jgi:leucyl-tRNA synthetase
MVWVDVGKSGLAVKAPWPMTEDEDKLLTREASFLQNAMKNFRSQAGKAKKGWNEAAILVTDSYPDWKISTLKWMQEQHDGHNFTETFMADLKAWSAKNISDKKLVKFTMQFAAFVKKEVEEVGAVAMDTELPFDQKAILEVSEAYIKAQLELADVKFINLGSDEAGKQVPDRIAENVTPGKPYLWLH